MILFFTTVIRAAPLAAGGKLVCLDWDLKRSAPALLSHRWTRRSATKIHVEIHEADEVSAGPIRYSPPPTTESCYSIMA